MRRTTQKSLLTIAAVGVLVTVTGCSNATDGSGAAPPSIGRAAYKSLKLGSTREALFEKFGRSEFAEGPSPATSKVLAERCYTYSIPGEPYPDGASWWLCFDGTAPHSKLVHKEKE